MLIISKSISINLLELNSYEENNIKAFEEIINLLISINFEEKNLEILKNKIQRAANVERELLVNIRNIQEKLYGQQTPKSVSFSTVPNKAVLVVGTNIKELENILNKLYNENIDIYTHDDMM